MRFLYLSFLLTIMACSTQQVTKSVDTAEQSLKVASQYSKEELRGSNTEYRNWWNVLRYDLVLSPDFEKKHIAGSLSMQFEITGKEGDWMQIDLQQPMELTKIVQLANSDLKVKPQDELTVDHKNWFRLDNTIFINYHSLSKSKSGVKTLKFYFEGNPRIAKNAPWDGGWIFTEDEKGRPWMTAAVQGLGASSWFPCKDYQGDEPDQGATITMIVPEDLVAVSNGRLWETSFVKGEAGTNVYTWEVRNPINSYNIIPYIGHYVEIKDAYMGERGTLSLKYWVLDYNEEKATKHFEQVKPMMAAFEDWMGPYPFYEDGFKLVETPHLGMEHQSAIAYGNKFMNGYLGDDRSRSGHGNKFDFIIVHESGHEWFGNSITTEDVADLWVHEGFTTYTEAMYIENQFGKEAAAEYIQGLRALISNDSNIIGVYGLNQTGGTDMYYKGANIIHTLRHWMNNDSKFKGMIRSMNQEFYHHIVSSAQIEKFIADYAGLDLKTFFDQYLRTTSIPTLEIRSQNAKKYYRWINVVDGFNMPLRLNNSTEWIQPTTEWQTYTGKSDLIIDPNFYIHLNYSR
ncbi:M1 family metallopeptidase [Weeksellaceae bacterium KMM 9713]|uniref:M1 family metallopeptidase n=1 Tax=Profundicola chukchiensis TaxID=2961959 RepID=A0A9X4N0H8_9FLAO|nr:M1 family metallopeptidase [Profundicola chukchiensis]MDG4946472.1 M1 family metallopeptidase [Profundicola chukchiensis]